MNGRKYIEYRKSVPIEHHLFILKRRIRRYSNEKKKKVSSIARQDMHIHTHYAHRREKKNENGTCPEFLDAISFTMNSWMWPIYMRRQNIIANDEKENWNKFLGRKNHLMERTFGTRLRTINLNKSFLTHCNTIWINWIMPTMEISNINIRNSFNILAFVNE